MRREHQQSNPSFFVQAENEIPEWFSTTSTRTPISFPITGDNKWKGVAACAVFSVNAPADAEFSKYWYHFTLETDVVRLKPDVIDWEVQLRPFRSSSDLLLIKYEPRFRFSEWQLNLSIVVRASFETNNPFMVVDKCGIRLVYEQDAGWHRTHIFPASDSICLNEDEDDAVLESGWLSQDRVDKHTLKWEDFVPSAEEYIQDCMQKEDSFYDKLKVENWKELIRLQGGLLEGVSDPKEQDSKTGREKEFELHSQKYINWDWSAGESVHCTFYRAEISKWKWFMHFKEGNSAEIQLPPNLFDDANWLGIAVCAFYRLSHEDPNMSAGSTSPDSEYNVLTCRMKSDIDWANLHDLIFQGSITKPELSDFEHDSTWFYYIPRKCINKFWRRCKLARATFLSSRQWIGVHGCALGLVYKEDVERLVQTLTSCDLP